MTYFIGIDIGGTVIKSGLYNERGQEKAVASETDPAVVAHVGWCERDMIAMWRTVCITIRRVLAESGISAHDVAGISFSAHGKGLYAVDADGRPVRNGIISSDNRALGQVRAWKAAGVDAAAYPVGYQQLWSGHPVSLLAWMKANEPQAYRNTRHVLMAHDWIRYKLTGAFAAEITNISGSNLYNVETGAYDPALFRLFGIDEMIGCMPPVIDSQESIAGVGRRAAEETGLVEGTPVFGGFFDVVSAAVCAGLSGPDHINIVMGTWTIVTWIADQIRKADHPYIWGRYCIPDKYFVHEGSPTSAGNLEWFVRTFMAECPDPFDRCNRLVSGLPKAATELQFLPYLFSSNLGDNLAANLWGLANAHGLDHILQAIYEGICFSQHVHLERILALAGRHGKTLRLTGGPTHSPVWMQMVADVSELPVEVMHVEQSGCLGAAIAAAVGSGAHASFADAMATMCPVGSLIEPDPTIAPRYREKYATFRSLAATLDAMPVAGRDSRSEEAA
ncbi:MAG: carbohydrate kinase [Ancalomicrobiaceae bacterium]|nr:carbohydrate kinase [Ancalomicrobiaceae bacterium]